MAFIVVKTNQTLTESQIAEFHRAIGQAVTLIPNQSANSILVNLEPDSPIWLQGTTEPAVLVKMSVFANEAHIGFAELSTVLTDILTKLFQIAPQRIFIQFEDIQAWSMAGHYIESRG